MSDDTTAQENGEAGGDPTTRRLGDFELLREIGRGGMGVVYEARQISLKRRVALKVLPPAIGMSAQAKQRFEREAQAAAKLHHTNIVPVHAIGEHDGHQKGLEAPEGLDRAGDDDGQAGGGARDAEMRAAQPPDYDPPDDAGDQTREQGRATGEGDPQTQGHGDEEDDDPGGQIVLNGSNRIHALQ